MQKIKLIAEKVKRIEAGKYLVIDKHSTIKTNEFKAFKDKYLKLGYRVKWIAL